MAAKMSSDHLDSITCSVCKDVYDCPVKISCGHTFCEECVNNSWKSSKRNPTCPICRMSVDGEKEMDFDMVTVMSAKSTNCRKCNKFLVYTNYRGHEKTCKGNPKSIWTSMSGRYSYSEDVKPNIYTFQCPYCRQKNLDREGLIGHVNEQHKQDPTKVVCPICMAMPWGKSDQFSQNFNDHLNLRHQFDYDRFVDLNQDEDTAYENTLALSSELQ